MPRTKRLDPALRSLALAAALAIVCLAIVFLATPRTQAVTIPPGKPNFDTQLDLNTRGDAPINSVAAANFDDDGILDIVTGQDNGQVNLYLSTGSEIGQVYHLQNLKTISDNASRVAVGNIDGNATGDDIVVANSNQKSLVLLNAKAPFTPLTSINCDQPSAGLLCFGPANELVKYLSVSNIHTSTPAQEILLITQVGDGQDSITLYAQTAPNTITIDAQSAANIDGDITGFAVSDQVHGGFQDIFIVVHHVDQANPNTSKWQIRRCEYASPHYDCNGSNHTVKDLSASISANQSISGIALGSPHSNKNCRDIILTVNGGQNQILPSDVVSGNCAPGDLVNLNTEAGSSRTLLAADVNGDSQLDILTGDSNKFSIYQPDGMHSFALAATFARRGATNTLLVQDLDGNTRPDIVAVGTGQPTVYWDSTIGQALVQPQPKDVFATKSALVASADTNNDAQPDVIAVASAVVAPGTTDTTFNADVYTRTQGLTWEYLGVATDTYTVGTVSALAVTPAGEVAVAVDGGQSLVYARDAHGTYHSTHIGGNSDKIVSVASQDIDGDHRYDIVVGRSQGPGMIYLQAANKSFPTNTNCPDAAHPPSTLSIICIGDQSAIAQVRAAQFQFSGQPAQLGIAAARADGTQAVYFQQTGALTITSFLQPTFFGAETTYPIAELALGDLNQDGSTDIAAARNGGQNTVYLGSSLHQFAQTILLGTDGEPITHVAIAGSNVIASDGFGTNVVYQLEQPDPALAPLLNRKKSFGTSGGPTTGIIPFGLNSNDNLVVSLGREKQSLSLYHIDEEKKDIASFGALYGFNKAIAAGDMNNDGKLDLVVASYGGQNQVYINDGHGFSSPIPFGSGADQSQAIALADMNNDGWLDIVVGNNGGIGDNAEQSLVYFNVAGTSFSDTQVPGNQSTKLIFGTTSDSVTGLAVGDIDGDGTQDIVAQYSNHDAQIYFHKPDQLVQATQPLTGTIGDIAIADVDNQLGPDLIVGRYGEQSHIYLNNGFGGFTLRSFGGPEDTFSRVAAADINHDGQLDLVAVHKIPIIFGLQINQVEVLINQGAGLFATETSCTSPWIQCIGGISFGDIQLTLADVDSDGWIDVVENNDFSYPWKGYIYLNNQGTFPRTLDCQVVVCFGGTINYTPSQIIAADTDGRRGMDLVALSGSTTSRIFVNSGDGSMLTKSDLPSAAEQHDAKAVALADLDDDHQLDVVLATSNGLEVRHNDSAQSGTFSLAWNSSAIPNLTSVIVGDLDAPPSAGQPEYLDLVAADSTSLRIFSNQAGSGFREAEPIPIGSISSIALGDLDGDKLLDIVVGRSSGQSVILLNQKNPRTTDSRFSFDPTVQCADGTSSATRCFGAPNMGIQTVALADVNSDGALDIVAATQTQSLVYFNDGAGNFNAINDSIKCDQPDRYRCIGASAPAIRHIGSADMNGDGAIDILVGVDGGQGLVYLNDGDGRFETKAVDCNDPPPSVRCFGNGSDTTKDLVTGDIDGDGAIDVAVANQGGQSLVYLNDSRSRFPASRVFGGPTDKITRLALGDMNNDGRIDLVATAQQQASRLYLSEGDRDRSLPNNLPQIVIQRPGNQPEANFFSIPQIIDQPVVDIPFSLYDREGDPVRAISVTYSLDGGANWQTAVPTDTAGSVIGSPSALPTPIPASSVLADGDIPIGSLPTLCSQSSCQYSFHWDVAHSAFFGQSDNVVIRMLGYSGSTSGIRSTAGLYQRPYVSAQSFPFRARGLAVQISAPDDAFIQPVRSDLTHKLFLPAVSAYNPSVDGPNQRVLLRDLVGARVYCIGDTPGCQGQALGKTGRSPFITNSEGILMGRGRIENGTKLIALLPVPLDSQYTSSKFDLYYTSLITPVQFGSTNVQHLEVSSARPLVLFNLTVSLEWDASNDATFSSDLNGYLLRTSQLLYDWTNGQAALGKVTIYQNKNQWDAADIRIYASNRIRPNATQGGIVGVPKPDPLNGSIVYKHGQIQIGPVWSRWGNTNGDHSEDWPRALAHELGHYLFYLDDNYLGLNNDGVLIPIPRDPKALECPGAMTDPYREGGDYGEFVNRQVWSANTTCSETLAARLTGRHDWRTITTFYPWLDGNHPDPGPSTLPFQATQIVPGNIVDTGNEKPLLTGEPFFYLNDTAGRHYTPRDKARAFLFRGNTIVDLGRPTDNLVLARGVRQDDNICVYDPQPASIAAQADPKNPPDVFRGCLEHATATNASLTMNSIGLWYPEIRVTPVTSSTINVQVLGVPSSSSLTIQLYPANTVIPLNNLTQTVPAQNGIYTATFSVDPQRAASITAGYIRVQQTDNPAREIVTDYALGGGPVSIPAGGGGDNAPSISADGQLIMYVKDVVFTPEQLVVLQAVTHRPELPAWATQVGQMYRLAYSPNMPDLQDKVSVSFNYLGREVPQGEASSMAIYYQRDGETNWSELKTEVDTNHNIASARAPGPGLYALGSSVVVTINTDKDGWATFPYPVRDTRPITQALASIDGQYKYVATIGTPARYYDVKDPTHSTLLELAYADGSYIILMNQKLAAVKLRLKGPLGAPVLNQGVQTLSPASTTYYGTLSSASSWQPEPGTAVQAWVEGALCGQGQTYTVGDSLGYQVTLGADRHNASVCSQPGRTVTFRVGAHTVATTAKLSGNRFQALRLEVEPKSRPGT